MVGSGRQMDPIHVTSDWDPTFDLFEIDYLFHYLAAKATGRQTGFPFDLRRKSHLRCFVWMSLHSIADIVFTETITLSGTTLVIRSSVGAKLDAQVELNSTENLKWGGKFLGIPFPGHPIPMCVGQWPEG